MMKPGLIALILLASPPSVVAGEPDQATQRIDLAGVTAIVIAGEATSITLTTNEDEPYQATLGGMRSGWFAKWYSSWFYTDENGGEKVDHGSGGIVLLRAA